MILTEWQNTIKPLSDIVFNASETVIGDAWVPFTIGVSIQFVHVKERYIECQLGSHSQWVHCAINQETDQRRRGNEAVNRRRIVENLRRVGIINQSQSPSDYFLSLPKYKFVISPEGNGLDCHRHYEAWMAGCIPIIERNPLIEAKYRGLPVLYTTDYSELTPEYLNNAYENMKNTSYDFSSLLFSNLSPVYQTQIRANGNYWGTRLVNYKWY